MYLHCDGGVGAEGGGGGGVAGDGSGSGAAAMPWIVPAVETVVAVVQAAAVSTSSHIRFNAL